MAMLLLAFPAAGRVASSCRRPTRAVLALGLVGLATACTSSSDACPNPALLVLSPAKASVAAGSTLSIRLTGGEAASLSWSVREPGGGSVSATGDGRLATYSAPAAGGTYRVRATSTAPDGCATAEVEVLTGESAVNTGLSVSPIRLWVAPALEGGPAAPVQLRAVQHGRASASAASAASFALQSSQPEVIWYVREGLVGGSVSASGAYLPGAQPGLYHVIAALQSDPTIAATADIVVSDDGASQNPSTTSARGQVLAVAASRRDAVRPSRARPPGGVALQTATLDILPYRLRTETSATSSLTAHVEGLSSPAVSWSLEDGAAAGWLAPIPGSDPNLVRYTAPATPGVYRIAARSVEMPSLEAYGILEVGASVQITCLPLGVEMEPGGLATFTTTVTGALDQAVAWTIDEGAVGGSLAPGSNGSAVYTAPASPGAYHVRARSLVDPAQQAVSFVRVRGSGTASVVIRPASALLSPGSAQLFTASIIGNPDQSVTFSASAGTVTADGLYTAPMEPGTYTVTAARAGEPTQFASATVGVASLPVFTSAPAEIAYVRSVHSYAPTLSHPEGLDVELSLDAGPTGAAVDGGKLTWTPALEQVGRHEMLLRATDTLGNWALQLWTLEVRGPGLYRVAGTEGSTGFRDGPGLQARFGGAMHLAFDSANQRLIVVDKTNSAIRAVGLDGQVTTLAGSPIRGYRDGAAAQASFNFPTGAVFDGRGDLLVTDGANGVLRRVAGGTVSSMTTLLPGATSPVIDPSGNLHFIAGNQVFEAAPDGTVTLVAGGVEAGHADGEGAAARFAGPVGLVLDSGGNLFVVDRGNHVIRQISSSGTVSTFVGTPSTASYLTIEDGTGPFARFSDFMGGLAIDGSDTLYLAERKVVRRIYPDGVVTTWAGSQGDSAKSVDGSAAEARFWGLTFVGTAPAGELYVADGPLVRRIDATGRVTTLAGRAGNWWSPDAVPPGSPRISDVVVGMRFAPDGSLYLTDHWSFYRLDAGDRLVKLTVAGTMMDSASGRLAVTPGGEILFTERSRVQKVSPGGTLEVVAGASDQIGNVDDQGAAARFGALRGIAVDPEGNAYVADVGNSSIRRIDPTGQVTTLAETVGAHRPINSAMSFHDGRLYFAPNGHGGSVVAHIPGGASAVVAGDSTRVGNADGPGPEATFGPQILDVAADPTTGDLYVADSVNNAVRRITPAGQTSSVVGAAPGGYLETGPLPGRLYNPVAIAVSSDGRIYIACGGQGNSILLRWVR